MADACAGTCGRQHSTADAASAGLQSARASGDSARATRQKAAGWPMGAAQQQLDVPPVMAGQGMLSSSRGITCSRTLWLSPAARPYGDAQSATHMQLAADGHDARTLCHAWRHADNSCCVVLVSCCAETGPAGPSAAWMRNTGGSWCGCTSQTWSPSAGVALKGGSMAHCTAVMPAHPVCCNGWATMATMANA